MTQGKDFKGRQFTAEVILWAVRWYLMFPISYRDLELMLQDRGVAVDHTTLFRWIQAYAPELEKRIRPHLHRSNGSWRVDETYVKVKGRWTYLYRAVDSRGQTIDFLLSAKRDAAAAKRFFRKALGQPHTGNPRTITVDKNAAYPAAVTAMKRDGELWRFSRLRQVKYLNNIVEQDHRRIKRLVRPGLGFGQSGNGATNIGRLRGDGDDQKGAGSEHWRGRYAGSSRLRCWPVRDCGLIWALPPRFLSRPLTLQQIRLKHSPTRRLASGAHTWPRSPIRSRCRAPWRGCTRTSARSDAS